MRTLSKFLMTVLVGALLVVVPSPTAQAAGESWRVDSVTSFGCEEFDTVLTVTTSGMAPSTAYHRRTLVTSAGSTYMNEDIEGNVPNQTRGWGLYESDSGGPVSTPSWPIPFDQQVRVELTLTDSGGLVLHKWTLVLESCNTGTILYNDLTSNDTDGDLVPNTSDKCPQVAGPGVPTGCPKFTRTIKINGKSGKRIRGSLTCVGCESLASGQTLRVYFKGKKRFKKKIAKFVTTNQFGIFKIKRKSGSQRLYKGKYWVKAPFVLDPDVGQAAKLISKKVRR